MIESEEVRADIDRYLMERFKYHKSLVCLTVDNVIDTRRNSRVDLYLRIRRIESRFPPDYCPIKFQQRADRARNALYPISDQSSPQIQF